ncbi:alpha/beta fold hydrolase [Georgenia sp. H159]|uniref:alpha/beta fold hydrolase n=1 Tax=Georgenia sp. H159 TaxID=3076115 RepID=UPI002D76CC87|nr:alpha/beta fold hydrolase [Georgenia sp. H159]
MDEDWTRVALPDGELEVLDIGTGEPLLLVQTAQVADELLLVGRLLAREHRVVLTHRRGYAGSSPTAGAGSVRRDAADCVVLLDALGIGRAHVVGLSYSGAVALELALRWPDRVHTLSLVEPPPLGVPAEPEFRAVCTDLLRTYEHEGPAAALASFMERLVGTGWRTELDAFLPGTAAAVERDNETFFATDIPALLGWHHTDEDARAVRASVLHVGGTDSGPWFAQVRERVLDLVPGAEDVVVRGAGHTLALTHAPDVAAAVSAFVRTHPLGP